MREKKQFNIVRSDRTTHGGYHTGTLNLNNLSALLIDGEQVKIDLGLIHAKSSVERGIRFKAEKDEVLPGKHYWVVWVTLDRNETGSFYAGLTACLMIVDHEQRRGWKNLAEHVNRMDDALKRRIKIEELPANSKRALHDFLQAHDQEIWNNSPEEIKQSFVEK